MNIYSYLLLILIGLIAGTVIGCFLRLYDKGLPLSSVTMFFRFLYCVTIGFVTFASKNKNELIDVMANKDLEKGQENKKAIYNEKKKSFEDKWSEEFLRGYRKILIKYFLLNFDEAIETILDSMKELFAEEKSKKSNRLLLSTNSGLFDNSIGIFVNRTGRCV